jgi:pimeloyl-ACP methyl ester carboxylesterase
MNASPKKTGSRLRGISRLAFDAVVGLTGLVETMHGNIAGLRSPFGSRTRARTRGITRLVYSSIQGITRLTGAGVDAALGMLDPLLAVDHSTPRREAALAALNGVLGDHLAETANPLSISMRLRHNGRPLRLEREGLAETLVPLKGRLAVLVHGLCLSDLQWKRHGHDHGAALARDVGYTPLYLHYNSGLHISANGRAFAELLESLVQEWPALVEELVIIGHSMGGLVSRSACYYGDNQGHEWLRYLSKLIFLGTPHHGAPMERAGQWLHRALQTSRYTTALANLGRIRSAGITDLRYGNLLDADWQDRDRFEHVGDTRQAVSLPKGVQCFAIAASTGDQAGALRDRLLGDGLVPVHSALGEHKDPRRSLAIPVPYQWVGRTMSHFDLLSRQDVYEQSRRWLTL